MDTWNQDTLQTNHTALMRKASTATMEECHEVIKQCQEAIEAMPDGNKAGHYADEIHYYAARLRDLQN